MAENSQGIRRLLVVDDESSTRRLVEYIVKALGIDVVGAATGAEALTIVQQQPVGMVLVDINLPVMDGFTLIRHLREVPSMQDVPIITFTARDHPDDQNQARALGVSGFLYKPFTTGDLRALVSEHMPG